MGNPLPFSEPQFPHLCSDRAVSGVFKPCFMELQGSHHGPQKGEAEGTMGKPTHLVPHFSPKQLHVYVLDNRVPTEIHLLNTSQESTSNFKTF